MRFVWTIPLVVGLLLIPASELVLGQAGRPPDLSPAERHFIDRHWRRPIALQDASPGRFSPIERSLASASCGTCHPAQYADWRTTLHSRSMGPGVAGQLAGMFTDDPESARACLDCHAPLAEQSPQTIQSKTMGPNPAFDASLQAQGLVCASCHVRGHQRFGPPRRDGPTASSARHRAPTRLTIR